MQSTLGIRPGAAADRGHRRVRSTNRAGKPVAIQGAYALAVAPGGTAYVLATPDPDSQQGFVVPVRVRAGTQGNLIKVGLTPLRIAFIPDGKMAYVANYASGSVTPIRLADGRAGPRTPVREAALRAGPGHSDPRRDELAREASKGRPAPGCHRDRPLNLRWRPCPGASCPPGRPRSPAPERNCTGPAQLSDLQAGECGSARGPGWSDGFVCRQAARRAPGLSWAA